MAERSAADLAFELASEKRLLQKADADIDAGRERLHNQRELVSALRASGHNTIQGERLAGLMTDALLQWERHRGLIQQRIEYLEAKTSAG